MPRHARWAFDWLVLLDANGKQTFRPFVNHTRPVDAFGKQKG
ncbi:MAG TPA: hypothetical protein VJ748_00010 [Vitreimonas sp.]|jgi:hypothetical protein|nr:hypothetical protein [Vitreimonas sp.]